MHSIVVCGTCAKRAHEASVIKKQMQIIIRTVLPDQFYLSKVQSYIFYKHFLNSPILYEGSTLINFGFFIKEDF